MLTSTSKCACVCVRGVGVFIWAFLGCEKSQVGSLNFISHLGNGNIQLFRFEGKKKFTADQCLNKHTSSASQVHFPKFHPNMLVSGGNDCKIILWNLSGGTCNSAANCQETEVASSVCVLHEVEHGSKPNWITTSSLAQNIFVADQTSEISVYHLS